ncbi:MAG: RtcB family protein, partial [Planctomycetota bacterium]
MMNDSTPVSSWLIEKMPADVYRRVNEMARTDDVVHVAVMPDVHLSREYCVGTAVATNSRLFPTAVGADIGCGMAAVQVVDGDDLFKRYDEIGTMLKMLRRFIPPLKQSSSAGLVDRLPDELQRMALSCPRLFKFALRDGRYQFGTLGRGNHFLEFQRDEAGELWIMLHSGSRAMGQVITRAHLENADHDSQLPYLDSNTEAGQNYLLDVRWARHYASMNRRRMLELTEALLL